VCVLVWHERVLADPTVRELESLAAEMLGKEAGLFVPSGTMGNLCGALANCSGKSIPGEVIVGNESHMFHYEVGGLSSIGGLAMHQVPTSKNGELDLALVRGAIREEDVHFAPTRLITVENTHNRMGGQVLSAEYMEGLGALCKEFNIPLHVDGARLMNAASALGVHVSKLVEPADTVSLCLSKGLGAPVGSVVVGSAPLIRTARHIRKMLGGGMRQAGVIAASGIVALKENSTPQALGRDHRNAKMIARALAAVEGARVAHDVVTNIVYATIDEKLGGARALVGALKDRQVLVSAYGTSVRFVTHRQITDADADRAAEDFEAAMKSLQVRA
jgi:threonine aldolase